MKKKYDYEMTQDEIAQKTLMSRNMVNEIEKRALEKLRKIMKKRGIKAKDVLLD